MALHYSVQENMLTLLSYLSKANTHKMHFLTLQKRKVFWNSHAMCSKKHASGIGVQVSLTNIYEVRVEGPALFAAEANTQLYTELFSVLPSDLLLTRKDSRQLQVSGCCCKCSGCDCSCQCCGSIKFWYRSGSGPVNPYL